MTGPRDEEDDDRILDVYDTDQGDADEPCGADPEGED
jgi:hypothetical protein